MSKKSTNELVNFILTFVILSCFLGIKETLNIAKLILGMVNSILVSFYDTTILTVMFKYVVTFPLVGIFLMNLGSPKGKEGYWIGKVLYFIIGYAVSFLLDIIAGLIF
ncbi:MAG: hypothetical protein IKM55_00770 [Bacilli bacterium]|nr:hypothetical protein [Bacilli bacterium]